MVQFGKRGSSTGTKAAIGGGPVFWPDPRDGSGHARHNPHGVNKRCHDCGKYFSGELEGDYRCLACSLRAAEEQDADNLGGGGAHRTDQTRASVA